MLVLIHFLDGCLALLRVALRFELVVEKLLVIARSFNVPALSFCLHN